MTIDRDLDRLLDRWFADGPMEVGDRLIDEVADRVARQPQLPAWRVSRRDTPMNIPIRILVAAAAIIVVAIVGWSLLPGGSPNVAAPVPTVVPTAVPTASVAPSLAATPRWDSGQAKCGQTGCGGPLAAGTYTSRSLQPAVTYTLTDPWVNVSDWKEFFKLYPDTPGNRMREAAGEYAPYILVLPALTVSPSRTCVETATDNVPMDSRTLGNWLAGEDGVSVTDPVPVTMSGLDGLQMDLATTADWTGCLPGQPIGETNSADDRYRFIVLDQPDGGTLMIRLWAPAAEFEAFVAQAMPVVESFEFDLSALPSPAAS